MISIHAPREGRDHRITAITRARIDFNPRAPRGARLGRKIDILILKHFNPRAPRGARQFHHHPADKDLGFQSTRPARGATFTRLWRGGSNRFQSTRPARGATGIVYKDFANDTISIHAPREGRDIKRHLFHSFTAHFNPRAPRGARLCWSFPLERDREISIHAPREGRDRQAISGGTFFERFQSTRPARGATKPMMRTPGVARISIHAPREGRDCCVRDRFQNILFQSTRPARGATTSAYFGSNSMQFQSTRPARGATS